MFVKATMLLVREMKRIQCGMQQIIYKTPSKLSDVTPVDGAWFENAYKKLQKQATG